MIKKYRRKPLIIEAVIWKASKNSWDNIMAMGLDGHCSPGEMGSDTFYIETLEGKMKADIGDYIIKGTKGEFYPCKPDIFEQIYEEVQED